MFDVPGLTVEGYAFCGCTGINNLKIKAGDTVFKRGALSGCTGITEVEIPVDFGYKVADIKETNGTGITSMFSGVSNVSRIHYTKGETGVMPDRVTSSGADNYYGYTLEFFSGTALKEIVFDEGITEIGDYAYTYSNLSGNRKLSSILLPKTMISIGYNNFQNIDKTKLTVYGYKNTFAESYANSLSAKFIPLYYPIFNEDNPDTLYRGISTLLKVKIYTGIEEYSDYMEGLIWSISGNENSNTAIDQNGMITVDAEETAEELVICVEYDGQSVSLTLPVSDINPELKSVSLTLTGNIGVNFLFDIPEVSRADTYISFTLNGETKRYCAKDAEEDENGWLRFSVLAAAKEIRDTITVRVENEAGELKQFKSGAQTIEGTFTYSVEKYFKTARKNYSDKTDLMNLINAMDTYGKYAQIKFDHVTEGMGTPDALEEVNLADLDQFKPVDTGSVTGITMSSISLSLETDTGVKAYFTVDAGHSINDYVITADNAEVELVASGNENEYYAQLKGAAAADLDEPIDIIITNNDQTETENITYYPLSYVRSILKNSAIYEADLVDVCKALYWYWFNTEAYFAAQQTTE